MTKRRKLDVEVIIFLVLYAVLFLMVVLGHNLLDIVYLLLVTFYLIRLFLCRRKKKSCK